MGLSRFLEMMLEYLGVLGFVRLYFRFHANPTCQSKPFTFIYNHPFLPDCPCNQDQHVNVAHPLCSCHLRRPPFPKERRHHSRRSSLHRRASCFCSSLKLARLYWIGCKMISRLQATYGKLYCRSTTDRRRRRKTLLLVLPLPLPRALGLPDHVNHCNQAPEASTSTPQPQSRSTLTSKLI